MNNKISNIENIIYKSIERLMENIYLGAIKDGLIAVNPLLLIMSILIFYMVLSPVKNEKNMIILVIICQLLLSLIMSTAVSKSLAIKRGINTNFVVIVSVLSFIILASITMTSNVIESIIYIATTGIFVSIFCSLIITELYYIFINVINNISVKIPKVVISVLAEVVISSLILAMVLFLTCVLNIELYNIIIYTLKPLQYIFIGNSIIVPLVIVGVITLLWSLGIHAMSVISILFRPFWIYAITVNMVNAVSADVMPFIASEAFYQWFIWIGGTGGTIGLILATKLIAKSTTLKEGMNVSLLPSIFNINESVIFGYPIIKNKNLIVPFIIGPLVVTIVSHTAIKMGLVTAPFLLVPWVLPAPLGAVLSTMDLSALWLIVVNIILLTLIYLPFVRKYDKELLSIEK